MKRRMAVINAAVLVLLAVGLAAAPTTELPAVPVAEPGSAATGTVTVHWDKVYDQQGNVIAEDVTDALDPNYLYWKAYNNSYLRRSDKSQNPSPTDLVAMSFLTSQDVVCMDPGGNYVYNVNGNTLRKFDTSTGSYTQYTLSYFGNGACGTDGQYLYVPNGTTVYKYTLTGGFVNATTINISTNQYGFAVVRDTVWCNSGYGTTYYAFPCSQFNGGSITYVASWTMGGSGATPMNIAWDGTYYYWTWGGYSSNTFMRFYSNRTLYSTGTVYGDMRSVMAMMPPPTVATIAPNNGVQGSGPTSTTITGTNFVSGATVSFSGTGVTATSVSVTSPTSLTCNVSIAAGATPASRDVSVTTSYGTGTLTNGFTVNPGVPTLTGISPNSGAQGQTLTGVTLTGTNFNGGNAQVIFSTPGVTATNVVVNSHTQITCDINIAAGTTPGAGTVQVQTNGGTSGTQPFTVTAGQPSLTAIVPNSGVQGQTIVGVTLTGTNFNGGSAAVGFANPGVTASNVVVVSHTTITCDVTITSGAAVGAGDVMVTTAGGTGTLTGGFTVIAALPSWPKGWHEAKSMPKTPTDKAPKDGAWMALHAAGTDANPVIYVAKGNKATDFYMYDPLAGDSGTWYEKKPIPGNEGTKLKPPSKGCVGVSDGVQYVYMTKGNNTLGFWRYDAVANTWDSMPGVPEGPYGKRVKGGTDMVFASYKDTGCVYLLKGYKTEFYRYNPVAGRWDTLPEVPYGGNAKKYDKGSFL
ncbi:MAG: IPT/TIG domain-containing protein, partial [candidate division WOR-3 bacterium]